MLYIRCDYEKFPDDSIGSSVYTDEDFFVILQWLGLIGAYFNFGKTEEPYDVHDFEYEITITDYGHDIGKYLRIAIDNRFDLK